MNRKDIPLLVILVALFLSWQVIGPMLERLLFPKPPVPLEEPEEAAPSIEPSPVAVDDSAGVVDAVVQSDVSGAKAPETVAIGEPIPDIPRAAEQTVTLTNDRITLTFSSWGGCVTATVLHGYTTTQDIDAAVVAFDFATNPALVYRGIGGFGREASFTVQEEQGGRGLVLEMISPTGLALTRTIKLDDAYLLEVVDTFANRGAVPLNIPEHRLTMGFMQESSGGKSLYVPYSLGVDVSLYGGKGVEYLGKKRMPKLVKAGRGLEAKQRLNEPVDWVAVKNRFFTQIMRQEDGGDDCLYIARRENPKGKVLSEVAAEVVFDSLVVAAGATRERAYTYYMGPKKHAILLGYRFEQEKVMEFGLFTPICKVLLTFMNAIHDKLWPHNYGLAIMLLTVLIRVIFWPITHAGTVNMKKMQDVAPLMQEIKEKYKDNTQKQQQAMMALYKEHKVNPIGGCLPMLIQIPVFFALFVVLRSAIELRFAGFLWIENLSQPEGLFKAWLPFGGLNLLPIYMSATMLWQQKLMPTTADPRQAKIMQMMPIFMLVMFYPAPAGLALYWATNQTLMMAQQYLYKRKKDREVAA